MMTSDTETASQPAGGQPTESQPTESQQSASQSAEDQSTESQQTASQSAESQSAESEGGLPADIPTTPAVEIPQPESTAQAVVKAKSPQKRHILVAAGIAVAVIAVVAILLAAQNKAKEEKMLAQMEETIYTLTSAADFDEAAILNAYDEYEALTDTQKAKLTNRQLIISAYQEIQARIKQRKADAANVDSLISVIDYSNSFAEASTVKTAVQAYNGLSAEAQAYVAGFDTLRAAYDAVATAPLTVTGDNFSQAFVLSFSVGENTDYGGETSDLEGYRATLDGGYWNVTPQYDVELHHDNATPVYVTIYPRYSNLSGACSFHIDLHQTYTGWTDGEAHEFKLQAADIQYDSSIGAGQYQIFVEDNDASSSLLNLFGWSIDWNDSIHTMNDFDISRVKLSDVSGYIQY